MSIKTKTSHLQRIFAVLITAVMLVGFLPITASADFNNGDTPTIGGTIGIAWSTNPLTGGEYLKYVGVDGCRVSEYMHYTYYRFKDPKTGYVSNMPAYCFIPHLPGVAENYGGSRGPNNPVTFTVSSLLSDKDPVGYWIMMSGYPYRTVAELGLNNEYEAYAATKAALWAHLGYRPDVNGPAELGAGSIFQSDQDVDGHVAEVAKQIYNEGVYNASINAIPDGKIRTQRSDPVPNGSNMEYTITLDGSSTGYILAFEDYSQVPAGVKILSGTDRTEIQAGQVPVGVDSIIVQVPGTPDNYPAIPRLKVSGETQTGSIFLATSSYTSGQPFVVVAPTLEWDNTFTYFGEQEDDGDDPPEEVGFTVYKREYGTRIPLEGAEFQVFNPSNVSIGTYTTGPNGFVNIPLGVNPPYGNYRVVEINAPANYYIEPQESEKFILINENNVNSAQLEFVDKRYGALLVKKANGDGRPLEGASITINHPESGTSRTETTNAAGQILFEDLLPGTWTVLENSAPAGYIIDAVEHIQVVRSLSDNGGVPESIQLINYAKPGLRIEKFDEKTGFSIGGVKFEIFKDAVSKGYYTTGPYGWVEILDLEPGTYTIREVEVPPDSGLILDPASQTVELYPTDGVIPVYFINPENPTLGILK